MADEQLTFRPAGKTDASGDITFHAGDWRVEGWDSGTPAYRDELVTSADQDGAALSRVARREAVEWSIRLRLVTQGSMDTMLTKLRALDEALGTAERAYADGIDDPGVDAARLLWKPADATTTGILPLLRAEISERPISMDGDGIGWFLKTPVVTITGLRDPFIYGDLTQIKQEMSSGTPLAQEVSIPAVGGSVPPWMQITVEDKVTGAGQARNQVSMGLDSPDGGSSLVFNAGTTAGYLNTTGLAGTYSSGRVNVSSSDWVGAAQVTGSHRGQYRVVASNVKGDGTLRFRWGVSGQALALNLERSSDNSLFRDLDLGPVDLTRNSGGTWTGMLETKGSIGLSGVFLVPMSPWVKAETSYANSALGALTVDGTVSGTGELNGHALVLPVGTWSCTAGQWSRVTGPYIQRTAVSSVQRALAGSGSYTALSATVMAHCVGSPRSPGASYIGLMVRYVDADNYVALRSYQGWSQTADVWLVVRLGGTESLIANIASFSTELWTGWLTFRLGISVSGSWEATVNGRGTNGFHPALVTGGTLASGKVGLEDSESEGQALTRQFAAFKVTAGQGTVTPVLPAKKALRLQPSGMATVDGTDLYRVSHRGGVMMPPPDSTSRLLVASRRFSGMAITEAEGKTDSQQVTVNARKRWLSVP